MSERLDRVGGAITAGLSLLRAAGEPGHQDEDEVLTDLAFVLRARLGPVERGGLAIASLWALDADEVEHLAATALANIRAGEPVPPFLSPRDEARDWAAWASPAEHRAYLGACWHRLPDKDRSGFLKAARKVAA